MDGSITKLWQAIDSDRDDAGLYVTSSSVTNEDMEHYVQAWKDSGFEGDLEEFMNEFNPHIIFDRVFAEEFKI